MITVRLKGGLGNQMFQYAFALNIARKNKTTVEFDLTFLEGRNPGIGVVARNYELDIFGIEPVRANKKNIIIDRHYFKNPILNELSKKILGKNRKRISDKRLKFKSKYLNLKDNIYLDGYWQSEKYFLDIKNEIKDLYKVKKKIPVRIQALFNEINFNPKSVCVHNRRGDFLTSPMHEALGQNYYEVAEKLLLEKISSPFLYVFSDDINWCKENLKFKSNAVFVDDSFAGPRVEFYFELMKACKHFIVSNSTFAWWAAYLPRNKDKIVIAPKKWLISTTLDTSHIVPNDWITI